MVKTGQYFSWVFWGGRGNSVEFFLGYFLAPFSKWRAISNVFLVTFFVSSKGISFMFAGHFFCYFFGGKNCFLGF